MVGASRGGRESRTDAASGSGSNGRYRDVQVIDGVRARARAPRQARPPVAWALALAWCAICGWFAFVKGARVPLLWCVDLGFHELGHLVMYILPINEILTAAMGSIMQCAVPLGIATYFWFLRRDPVASVVCLAWGATNLQDASVYIADAPYEKLALIGGEHDWAFVFDALHRMDQAGTVATIVHDAGLIVLLAAATVAVLGLLGPSANARTQPADPDPDAAARPKPDDLMPRR